MPCRAFTGSIRDEDATMPNLLLCQGTALALPLRAASVHCCVTSPPYWNLRDYGTGTWQGGDAACTHVVYGGGPPESSSLDGAKQRGRSDTTRSPCPRCGATRVDAQLGLEATPDAYVAAMVQVFREVWRVLHPTGVLFINMGDSYQDKQLQGIPWKVAFGLQADGWVLRSDVIWDKPSCMPESVQDRPTRSHEYVFLFSKQARYFYDAEAVKEPTDMAYLLSRNPHGRAQNATAKNTIPGQGIKNNTSFNAAVTEALPYRNLRTVWRIASESPPLPTSPHFHKPWCAVACWLVHRRRCVRVVEPHGVEMWRAPFAR